MQDCSFWGRLKHWSQQGNDPTSHSLRQIGIKLELDLRLREALKVYLLAALDAFGEIM